MNKEVLNSLNPGEKTADIVEYYYGRNGDHLVYKVIIYTCKSFLGIKYTTKEKIPFYFKTKKLVQDYLENIDNFKYDLVYNGSYDENYYVLNPTMYKNPHYYYKMVPAYSTIDFMFHSKEMKVWSGYIDCRYNSENIYEKQYFLDIIKIEENAQKEGTTGNRFSYKLQKID